MLHPHRREEIEREFDSHWQKIVDKDRLGKIIGSQVKSYIFQLLDQELRRQREVIQKEIAKLHMTKYTRMTREYTLADSFRDAIFKLPSLQDNPEKEDLLELKK